MAFWVMASFLLPSYLNIPHLYHPLLSSRGNQEPGSHSRLYFYSSHSPIVLQLLWCLNVGGPLNPPSLLISTATVQDFILSDFMIIMPSLLILLTPLFAYLVHPLQYCWRELKKKKGRSFKPYNTDYPIIKASTFLSFCSLRRTHVVAIPSCHHPLSLP